jgi:hypothetical protein
MHYQAAKAAFKDRFLTARLKPCPNTNPRSAQNQTLLTSIVGLFVICAEEFLLLDERVYNLPIELSKIFREALAKNFEPAMPTPEILHPVPAVFASSIVDRFASHLGPDVIHSLPQKPRPNSISSKNIYKLNSLRIPDPEPAVDDEPLRWLSLRRALHLRDDFLRNGTRSLLIAGKVHRILGPALCRRAHVGRVTEHLRQRHDRLDDL